MRLRTCAALAVALAMLACAKSPEEKAAQHRAKAIDYVKEGKADEAMLEFRNAVQVYPKDKASWYQIGDLFLKKAQLKPAYEALRQAEKLDPKDLDVQVRLGSLNLLANTSAESRRRAELVLAAAPGRADARLLLGQVLLKEGKPQEAVTEFRRAIDLDRQSVENRLLAAQTLVAAGRYGEAREFVEGALIKDPGQPGALLILAQLADLQGDRRAADAAFARLLQAKPGAPVVWLAYGKFWLDKGELDKALQAYSKAADLDKTGSAGWEKVAEIYLKKHDYPAAERAIGQVLSKNPKSITGVLLDGQLLMRRGKMDEATQRFQTVLKEYPRHSEAWYYLGLTHYTQGSIQQAISDLRKSMEAGGGTQAVRMLLAQAYLSAGQPKEALGLTDEIVKARQVDPEALIIRATALMALDRVEEAQKLLRWLSGAIPGDARIWEHLGITALAQRKPGDAIDSFQRALDADPKQFSSLVLIAQTLVLEKRVGEAIGRVEKHIEKVGETAELRQLLGDLTLIAGDRGRARKEFERALQLDPNTVGCYLRLAELYHFPDETRNALAEVEKVLSKNPKHVEALMMKASFHKVLGQPAEAEKAYRRAIDANPQFVPALNDLAWNLSESGGNIDEALKYAEKAVELAPNSAGPNDTLGWIYVKKGAYLKGASHLESAAKTSSADPLVQYHLGKAYAGLGDSKRAVASFRKALSLSMKFQGAQDAEKTLTELQRKKG